jgi:L-fuculose-phosphate aldolase
MDKNERDLHPTSETLMHLEAYRQRPDINAVIHAHPPFSTALTIAGKPFPVEYIPEVLIALGDVPTASYATPGT